jgi:hypothetical protein
VRLLWLLLLVGCATPAPDPTTVEGWCRLACDDESRIEEAFEVMKEAGALCLCAEPEDVWQ